MPTGYLPLFPFASLADVRAWQASYQSRGHQPWHRGHDLTATAFAAFLGYTDVTQVAQSTVSGGDAHVEVGIKLLDGTIITAAIIHLVLFGSGTYAPWEVVGTDDHTFTVDRPGPRAPGPRADGEGPDPQAIARRRVVSRHTARGHVKNILMQLGTRSQLEAVVIAARAGFTARPTAGPEVT